MLVQSTCGLCEDVKYWGSIACCYYEPFAPCSQCALGSTLYGGLRIAFLLFADDVLLHLRSCYSARKCWTAPFWLGGSSGGRSIHIKASLCDCFGLSRIAVFRSAQTNCTEEENQSFNQTKLLRWKRPWRQDDELRYLEGAQCRTTASSCWKEPVEVLLSLEGLHFPSGLRMSQDPPRRGGRPGCGEGCMDYLSLPKLAAATATLNRISGKTKLMDDGKHCLFAHVSWPMRHF